MKLEKRLFFGCGVDAPWPENHPKGRILDIQQRHMTLAFLGNVPFQKILAILPDIPIPDFKVGLVGQFDRCLFLPEQTPRVVAWHVNWANGREMEYFQQSLVEWLQAENFQIKNSKTFLPHVTICRAPFKPQEWKHAFTPLPCLMKSIHLYESVGNLQYQSLWQHDLLLPFEEIEHTADIAFRIRGENMQQLYLNAQYALAFHYPNILPFLDNTVVVTSLDHTISALNVLVTKVDSEIGCPFKAVSFHGKVQQEINHTLRWEMVVDV
jgi:2'-5' RNA ligase